MKKLTKILAAITTLIVLATLAGCSVTTDTTPQKTALTTDNLCEILSDETIKSIIGQPYNIEPMDEFNKHTQGCRFINTATETEAKTFSIIARTAATEQTTKGEYTRAIGVWQNGNIPNRTYQPLKNLGTEAFWAYGKTNAQLITYQDTNLFIISLGYFNEEPEEQLEKAKIIARAAHENFN